MRLLDSLTLRLVSKSEGDIPPYAILSHTWGSDEEEVTFQDIQELSASRMRSLNGSFAHRVAKKAGFAKIRDSAKLAQSQGYAFIWIDTCCIDKTSSAELSEAINSMFRWYRDAAICYTFLNDVDYVHGDDEDAERFLEIRRSIWDSRWFTRGWTLQELIAPINVQFYSRTWDLLGMKLGSFANLVSDITGVDLDVLDGSIGLDDLSVAKKMKWAARRRTTRVEDLAYCLMGIFNVNMPLLYGEGEKAFMRLQEEILKVTDDQSIFAWRCPENDMLRYQLSGLLASSPSYFEAFGDMKPLLPDPSRASAPSTMTNAGLHVQLHLSKSIKVLPGTTWPDADQQAGDGSGDEYYAILDCYPRNGEANGVLDYYSLAIRLASLGGDQHARLNPERVFWLSTADREMMGGDSRYIYVKQLPAYGLPDITMADINGNIGSQSFNLESTHPHGRWSFLTRTLKPDTSTYNSALGVFRFAIRHNGTLETVLTDVYVGISPGRHGLLSWQCWCFQAPVLGDPRYLEPPHVSGLGTNEDILGLNLSDRHANESIVASVETVRVKNKTYVQLTLSEIHELEPGHDQNLPEHDSLLPQIYELDDEETTVGAMLETMAEIPTIKDTWQYGLGLLDTVMSPNGPPRIRVSPRESGGNEVTGDSFGHIVARAAKSDLKIDMGDQSEEAMFRNYFSLLLLRACIRNDVDAVAQLLDSPLSTALIEVRSSIAAEEVEPWHAIFSGFRPLHWASALGHVEVVSLLIKHDADAGSITNAGLSTIHLASLSGKLEIINHLYDATSHLAPRWFDAYHRVEKPAHLVASYIRTDDVAALLGKLIFDDGLPRGPANEPSADSEVGLDITAGDGLLPGLYSEVERGGDQVLNKHRETPLHRAAAMNNIHAAQCIISRSLDRPLFSKDSFQRTPLWHAAAAGAIDIVRLCLEYGVNVDETDYRQRTPLHAACRAGNEDVVEELIAAGADVNATTQEPGFTAWHFATLGGHANILRILLKHGAKLDNGVPERVWSRMNVEPIHIAAANGFLECAKVLVEAGCNVDCGSNFRVVVNSPNPSGVIVTKFRSWKAKDLAVLGSHGAVSALLLAESGEWPLGSR